MSEFKGTPGPWVVDVRGGCVAVYEDGRQGDTNGCHFDDDRNIAYSNKGAEYDKVVGYWNMDKKTIRDFTLISAAPELLDVCLRLRNQLYAAGYESEDKSLNPTKDLLYQAEQAIDKALGK
ncbi:hypothetical protein K9P34_08905 [Salmonella enterica subsp. enterica serovar Enteritidis]|uniref:hypothetical protein n=1 Tax=Salmonella enterica TaxID=28901 RepID=UPI0019FD690C|nr:hypothetical protein [Salmonella enterica]MBS2184755.1 hypothetical protein [Salmonella enterica subsp. enterica serovar 1,4,[5],12:i:-]MBS2238113.1 hypothetical protein [Salmonella enterica subsp. enterica serovar Typhimurium]QTZ83131.1 hypothetical protein [Salmonella phage S9-5]QXH32955.1 hypothetical protein [Salmonella phage vB_SalP_ABTNLsp11242]MBZ3719859.1 hypothetical protein [Salmonella enterica subsp. enterica serovar Enteritidis]